MTVAEALRKARELITPPEAWTQGVMALDEDGRPVWPRSDLAVRWCQVGAISRVCGKGHAEVYADAVRAVGEEARRRGCPEKCPTSFNDRATHAQVLAVLDAAAARAEEAGA